MVTANGNITKNNARDGGKFKNMEHSEFVECYGLPIIIVLVFIAGIVIGLNLSYYINKKEQ